MRKGLLTEAAIVGASFVAVGEALKFVYRKTGLDEENPAPRKEVPLPVFLFVSGAVGHLLWEATGGNRWFAKNYSATITDSERPAFLALQTKAIQEKA
jgi:hypothetical protein